MNVGMASARVGAWPDEMTWQVLLVCYRLMPCPIAHLARPQTPNLRPDQHHSAQRHIPHAAEWHTQHDFEQAAEHGQPPLDPWHDHHLPRASDGGDVSRACSTELRCCRRGADCTYSVHSRGNSCAMRRRCRGMRRKRWLRGGRLAALFQNETDCFELKQSAVQG
jgi:hypothetical protein